jgi:nucleotidyltransferase substrate binding protein (TIGR01987 family)
MKDKKDIRWEQRFSNYNKALRKLTEATKYVKNEMKEHELDIDKEDTEGVLEEIIKEGIIQRFEYTWEQAWNVMKDYALYQGNAEIGGSRDAIRFAFSLKLIENGAIWMDMIKSSIKTFHTYNEVTTNEIFVKIINEYHTAFLNFQAIMEEKRTGQQQNLFDKE